VSQSFFLAELAIGGLMILLSVTFHLGCATIAAEPFERACRQTRYKGPFRKALLTGLVVLWFFLAICIEAWVWALLFVWLEALPTLEEAVYFSTVTFTTLGYGDVVIEGRWRLLGAFEATNGTIIVGLTTAVIFFAVQRIYDSERPE